MAFKLKDVTGWHSDVTCTPTALAAITGKTPDEVAILLHEAAKIHGREISAQLQTDYNINDWLKVIQLLGGNWAPGNNYSELPFADRPTIDQWMVQTLGADLELVFCDNGGSIGHVFATMNNQIVDTYTNGKRIKFEKVPPAYATFRVKRSFLVW
jgi:hypothetical protein